MNISKALIVSIFFVTAFQFLGASQLADQFKQAGYIELCDTQHGAVAYNSLYSYFDDFLAFLQANPASVQKLYIAKERFIRTKDRDFYATDFFGLYDESARIGRHHISFYYSIHFHDFLCSFYPEVCKTPQVMAFLNACREIQKPYGIVFQQAAADLGAPDIFSSTYGHPPLLLKVMKYLPAYIPMQPHYDGTVFSLFLDSSESQSLLLSPYKASFEIQDFLAPKRTYARLNYQNSILLIPGMLLPDIAIFPTPHIVAQSGVVRFSTIAFALRPFYRPEKRECTQLPNFNR